jgi:4-amino-4-deoxychorismate lyase
VTTPSRAVAVLGLGLVDPQAPAVHADDLGFSRGDGCFEATRVVTHPSGEHQIDHLTEHFDRFDRSCAGLDLPPIDRPAWLELIRQLLDGWTLPGEAMLRLLLSRGRESRLEAGITGVATLTPTAAETLRQRREGVDVITLRRGYAGDAFADAPWLLGGVKTLSYAVNMAGVREARRRGAHDVLFLDAAGGLLEAPTATVMWLADGMLHTVPVEGTGILDSITQRALFAAAEQAGYRTGYTAGTTADLLAADGAWLVSSGRGVAQLLTMDGLEVPGQPGLTAELGKLAGF